MIMNGSINHVTFWSSQAFKMSTWMEVFLQEKIEVLIGWLFLFFSIFDKIK